MMHSGRTYKKWPTFWGSNTFHNVFFIFHYFVCEKCVCVSRACAFAYMT